MAKKNISRELFILTIFASYFISPFQNFAYAEEGFWKYTNFPKQRIEKEYNFELNQNAIDNIRYSTIDFNEICTASFVSPDGLLQTNSHCIQGYYDYLKSSGKPRNKAFIAHKKTDEMKLKGVKIRILDSIYQGTKDEKFEKDCKLNSSEYKCNYIKPTSSSEDGIIEKYRIINDVRLVFAPEFSAANLDYIRQNFHFPRTSFDVAFLRAYTKENKSFKNKNYLKWSNKAPNKGEFTIVSGLPGYSFRSQSAQQLEMMKHASAKYSKMLGDKAIELSKLRGVSYEDFDYFELRNKNDVRNGIYQALEDGIILDVKRKEEELIKRYISENKKDLPENLNPYSHSIELTKENINISIRSYLLLVGLAENSKIMQRALMYPIDNNSSNSVRNNLPKLNANYALEEVAIEAWASVVIEEFKRQNITYDKIFNGKTPKEFGKYIVAGSYKKTNGKIIEIPNQRATELLRTITTNFPTAISNLPIAMLAQLKANNEISKLKSRIDPDKLGYPDADRSMRINFGTVEGEKDDNYFTILGDAFNVQPQDNVLKLPYNWVQKQNSLNLNTPYNFISTNDIIGGNSGSPIINKNSELIGVVFDGNWISTAGIYFYSQDMRAISLSNVAIYEVLGKVYGMNRLLMELDGKVK